MRVEEDKRRTDCDAAAGDKQSFWPDHGDTQQTTTSSYYSLAFDDVHPMSLQCPNDGRVLSCQARRSVTSRGRCFVECVAVCVCE
jgi:hypothetical protein